MARPSTNIFALTFIPNHRYAFSINRRDFRLSWALNCGSSAMSKYVPIYRPDVLDSQLDVIVSLSLDSQLYIKDEAIYLPQICQWYIKDFEYGLNGAPLIQSNSPNAPKAILNVLLKYCRREKEKMIYELLSSKKNVKIAFSPFSYNCRFFESFGGVVESEENKQS